MKRPALIFGVAVCLLAGWFLPTLWGPALPPPVVHRIPVLPDAAETTPSFTAGIKKAGSLIAQFQAIAAGVKGHGRSLAAAAGADALTDFSCAETEELTLQLAGEELAEGVTDNLAFLRSLKDVGPDVRAGALAAWAAKNPDSALQTLMSPGCPGLSGFDEIMINRLVERDPGRALQLLKTAAPGDHEGVWLSVLLAYAKKDAALALDTLKSAPYAVRKPGVDNVMLTMAQKDPQAALAWVNSLPPEFRGLASQEEVYRQWASTDPAAAAAAWRASGAAKDNRSMDTWLAAVDPEGTLHQISEDHDVAHPDLLLQAVSALAGKNPQQALAALNTLEEFQRKMAAGSVATAWPGNDLPAALSWARTLPDEEEKQAAMESLIARAGQIPAPERRKLLDELGTDTALGFQVLWTLDRKEALKNFALLPEEEQSSVWEKLAGEVVRASPEEASHLPVPEDQESEAFPTIAQVWAGCDPAAAADYVKNLPPGEAQSLAAENLISIWDRNDPERAVSWTQSLPEGAVKDAALNELAQIASKAGNADAAMKWSLAVQDPQHREDSLRSRFTELSETNPAAARAAIEALPLDGEEKERILADKTSPLMMIEKKEEDSPDQ